MKRRDVLKTLGISAAILGTGLFGACASVNEEKSNNDVPEKDTIPTKLQKPIKELSERDKKITNRDIKSIADPDNPEKAELKHTPDITVGNVDENGFAEIKIVIGQKGIIHPSTDTHWIDYISLSADEKLVGKLEFEAGTASGYAAFRVKTEGVKKLTAEAGCNIHGIWKHSVNL